MAKTNFQRVYQSIRGTPFRIGETVKIVGGTDETFDIQYLGKVGTVVYFDYSCGCGQSFPSDPMIGIRFNDLITEEFWKEEIETTNQTST